MTKEELEKEAEEKAEEIKKEQTLGVYDNEEDLKYDEGYNSGEVVGYEEGYLAGAESREKRIEELEKENEKLDKQIDTMLKDCKRCTYRKTFDQLTKAKEIIEEFMITETCGIGYSELYDKAGKFLKKIEK